MKPIRGGGFEFVKRYHKKEQENKDEKSKTMASGEVKRV